MNLLPRFLVVLCLVCSSHALFAQAISINEFLASNSAVNADEFGENDDWVELFNSGTTPIDIGGWHVTDDLDEPDQWQIPSSDPAITTIQPGGFLLLWFDKDTGQGPLHVNAKLSADGEDIGIFGPDDTTQIDALSFGPQSANISFGRTMDAGADWQFFQTPTPNATNSSSAPSNFAEAPTANLEGGFFQSSLQIELTSATPNADIRFTLDGSEPSENSSLFTDPLGMTATTTLRAKTFAAGYLPSSTMTQTYFVGSEHEFPVLALSFEDADFFDPDTGIYPNFLEDWERPVHVEFFETDNSRAFGQMASVEIHGTGSASLPQKSLKLKAIADGGSGVFDHQIFPDLPFGQYQRFLLRNSGQDLNVTQFRDGMVSSLVNDMSDVGGIIEEPNLFLQGFRPAVTYLNGEYWGIQNLREHMVGNYLEQHLDADLSEVDLLDNDDEAKEGDYEQWDELRSYLNNNHFFIDDQMESLASMVDIPHWLDYNAFNIIIDNTDWPGNNYRRWKERNTESQWRFLTYDLDFSFGLYTHVPGGDPLWNQGEASANSLARSLDSLSTGWPSPWWSNLLFRRTMENPQFRTDFANRTADFLNVLFEPDRVTQRIDDFESTYQPEIDQHLARWGHYPAVWMNNVELLRKFADERPAFVREHFVEIMNEVTGTASLTLQSDPPEGGHIKISTLDLPNSMLPWNGQYFTGIDIPMEAVAEPGFVFAGWSAASLGTSPATNLNLEGDLVLTAIFQSESIPPVGPESQTITFQAIPNKLTTALPFQVLATASSGLLVVFEIESGPATISGNEITLTGDVGAVFIKATQAGNADWLAAPPVLRSFVVTEPTIPTNYCEVSTDFPWYEWIERVQFGSIDKSSFKTTYSDFTSENTEVARGNTVTLTVTPAFSWEVWEEHFRAWIDFNQDRDFDDPGELVFEAQSSEVVEGEINIPSDALLGPTRMRVAMRREEWAEACESYVFGEVEDYTVVISSSGGMQPFNSSESEDFSINISPNPVDDKLSVQFSTKAKGEVKLSIVNSLGVNILQEKMILHEGEHHTEMDVSKFKSGIYTIVVDAEGMRRRAVQFIRAEK